MSERAKDDGGTDQHEKPDECDKCGDEADHRVVISANYEGAMENVRGLCDTHLKALGEWWRL